MLYFCMRVSRKNSISSPQERKNQNVGILLFTCLRLARYCLDSQQVVFSVTLEQK